MLKTLAICMACLVMSGCSAIGLKRIDSAGVPFQSEDAFQMVDLPLVLNPTGFPARDAKVRECIEKNAEPLSCRGISSGRKSMGIDLFGTGDNRRRPSEDQDEALERLRLETAFEAFYSDPKTKTENDKLRRNRVQQRLMMASDMNCGIFTQRIYQVQSSLNFGFGSLATVLGGAGAIVTDIDSARLLSGAASVMTGLRAEMNEDFFRRLWVEALVKAIDSERGDLRSAIEAKQLLTIEQYSVEHAVGEAIRYNDACSIVSGLRKVNEAVVIADDPAGLRAFRTAYSKAGFDADFKATLTSSDQTKSSRLGTVQPATASLALREIAEGVAQIRVQRTEADKKIKELPALDDAQHRNPAYVNTKAALDGLYSEDAAKPGTLQAHKVVLEKYRTDYAAYMDELEDISDAQAREQKLEFVRANDTASDIVRRAAMSAIIDAAQRIAAIVGEAEATSRDRVKLDTPTTTDGTVKNDPGNTTPAAT